MPPEFVVPVTVTGKEMPDVVSVPHWNPLPLAHCRAFEEPEQDDILKAVGEAVPAVAFASTVSCAIVAMPLTGSPVALVSVPLVGVPRAPE